MPRLPQELKQQLAALDCTYLLTHLGGENRVRADIKDLATKKTFAQGWGISEQAAVEAGIVAATGATKPMSKRDLESENAGLRARIAMMDEQANPPVEATPAAPEPTPAPAPQIEAPVATIEERLGAVVPTLGAAEPPPSVSIEVDTEVTAEVDGVPFPPPIPGAEAARPDPEPAPTAAEPAAPPRRRPGRPRKTKTT